VLQSTRLSENRQFKYAAIRLPQSSRGVGPRILQTRIGLRQLALISSAVLFLATRILGVKGRATVRLAAAVSHIDESRESTLTFAAAPSSSGSRRCTRASKGTSSSGPGKEISPSASVATSAMGNGLEAVLVTLFALFDSGFSAVNVSAASGALSLALFAFLDVVWVSSAMMLMAPGGFLLSSTSLGTVGPVFCSALILFLVFGLGCPSGSSPVGAGPICKCSASPAIRVGGRLLRAGMGAALHV
jgi:hypothetical protein